MSGTEHICTLGTRCILNIFVATIILKVMLHTTLSLHHAYMAMSTSSWIIIFLNNG